MSALRFAVPAAILATMVSGSARADIIIEWNARAEAIAVEKRMMPPLNARIMAILHVAMFEAVNAVERRYAPYRLSLAADKSVSREAAAASAAHSVLSALHADQRTALDAALKASLTPIPDGDSKTKGIALGRQAGAEVLALRADDRMGAPESYRPHTQSGVYVPTVVPVASTTGAVTPWVMDKGSQFRPGPPPALDSQTWTKDLNEIREVGGRGSTRRTPEQTDIGRFWFVTGPQAWNPIVRQIAAARKLELVDSARLFALVSMATSDSFIAVFDAKYHYNLWRPVTAIRNADQTGNKATPHDPAWLPLGDTPMHPEYPCAHCISSSAAGAVLTKLFGDEIAEVSMTSATAPGVTRKWTRIQDYTAEVSLARILAGFHYRFSTEAGEEMGRKIGELTVATQLRGAEATAETRR
jgi:hypothetical protein